MSASAAGAVDDDDDVAMATFVCPG